MKSKLEEKFPDAKVELIKGSGGEFSVTVDGRTIFSKKKSGRFPIETEIIELVRK